MVLFRVDKIILGYKFKLFMNNGIQFKSHKLYNRRKEQNPSFTYVQVQRLQIQKFLMPWVLELFNFVQLLLGFSTSWLYWVFT